MKGPSRRQFVKTGGGLLLASMSAPVVAACSALSTAPANSSSSGSASLSQKEAPMLSAMVKQGKLPKLADRLPKTPAAVKPLEQAGLYGGTLRRAVTSPTSLIDGYQETGHAGLVEWAQNEIKVVPGLAESWASADQGKTWTFHLRQGVKWSDGQPFTADDLVFAVQKVFTNKTLNPVFPTWLSTNGKPGAIEKIDPYTVRFTFQQPNALLLSFLAFPSDGMAILLPQHYLAQYLPDTTPVDQLTATAKKAGFATWDQLYKNQANPWLNADCPQLGAWGVTKAMTGANGQAILERNPYYWKTDDHGRQLPYIDRLQVDLIQNQETLALRIANGEIDWQNQLISFADITTLVNNSKQNRYKVLRWRTDAPWICMYTNQSHADPVVRKLMQDINFRAGLSTAINRKEMNNALMAGQGQYFQPCGISPDPYYEPSFGHTFTNFDVAKANQYLDKAGLTQKDGQGMRLRPDGQPLSLTITTFTYETGANSVDAYQYVVRYWANVGIKALINNIDSTLWGQRVQANQYDLAGYTVAGLLWEIDAEWYVPVATTCYWAPLFGSWYATNGQSGEEPPPNIRKLQQIYDQMKGTVDEKARIPLGRQILQAHNDNVWIIGTITQPFFPFIVNSDLVNTPASYIDSYRMGHESVAMPEQVAYRNPGNH